MNNLCRGEVLIEYFRFDQELFKFVLVREIVIPEEMVPSLNHERMEEGADFVTVTFWEGWGMAFNLNVDPLVVFTDNS